MRFDILTIFPDIFDSYLNESILKRAQKKKLIQIKIHNLRDFVKDKHKKVDDRPFGGGPGMVMQIQPLVRAVEFIKSKIKNQSFNKLKINSEQNRMGQKSKIKVILFSPAGKQFDNKTASDLTKKYDQLIFICGRYEGIDARLKSVLKNLKLKTLELSIGPYVLTGGELPAMILIDAISRQLPGVLGKKESLEEKRFGVGLPVYTRPEIFIHQNKKYRVPKVLLSGNHKKIEEWRKKHKS